MVLARTPPRFAHCRIVPLQCWSHHGHADIYAYGPQVAGQHWVGLTVWILDDALGKMLGKMRKNGEQRGGSLGSFLLGYRASGIRTLNLLPVQCTSPDDGLKRTLRVPIVSRSVWQPTLTSLARDAKHILLCVHPYTDYGQHPFAVCHTSGILPSSMAYGGGGQSAS